MEELELLREAPGQDLVFTDSPESFFREKGRGYCALFTGNRGVESNGALRDLQTALPRAVRFSGIEAEPSTATVERMARFLAEKGPFDTVFAAGGGSVLDAAKAALLMHATGLPLRELFGVNKVSQRFPGREFPRIIAIPTTSGTGSEATQYSNIVDREAGVKKLIAGNPLQYSCLENSTDREAWRATVHGIAKSRM